MTWRMDRWGESSRCYLPWLQQGFIHLPRDWGEADQTTVPQMFLLALLEHRNDICFPLVFVNLSQTSRLFKDNRWWPCNNTGLIGASHQAPWSYIYAALVLPNLFLLHQSLPPDFPYWSQKPGIPEGWCQQKDQGKEGTFSTTVVSRDHIYPDRGTLGTWIGLTKQFFI